MGYDLPIGMHKREAGTIDLPRRELSIDLFRLICVQRGVRREVLALDRQKPAE
jgi:hypothetical protein